MIPINVDKQYFLDNLKGYRECVPVGEVRVKTRCVLCGDSNKDPNKKRLYILCDPGDNSFVQYMCFNCGESGVLSADMLTQIIGDDPEMVQLLRRINKYANFDSNNIKVNKYKNTKEIAVEIPEPKKTNETIRKIQYLNKRIGYRIPLEDYQRLKFVFDLGEFLYVNRIPIPEKYKGLIEQFRSDYVGVLSTKNEYVILRDITGKHTGKFRYVKYNLYGMKTNAYAFYNINNAVNTLSREPIRIVAAEGPMDILSIVYNIYGGIQRDIVFLSTNNGTFYTPLMYYLNKGLVGSNIYIEIYRDADSIINYTKLKNQIHPFTKNFSVYRNTIGKDFGVPKDQFQIEKESY